MYTMNAYMNFSLFVTILCKTNFSKGLRSSLWTFIIFLSCTSLPYCHILFFFTTIIHSRMHIKDQIVNFQSLYISKALQLNRKIVIAYELKPPNHRRETKHLFSSPELPFCANTTFIFYSSYSKIIYPQLYLWVYYKSSIFQLNHNPLVGTV